MSDLRYMVLMDRTPAQFVDDGENDRGFYIGTEATMFRSRGIAKRRIRDSKERDRAWCAEENYEIVRLRLEP